MSAPIGKTTNVTATCEMKTIAVRIMTALCSNGTRPRRKRAAAEVTTASMYQRRGVRVKSTTGPQRTSQMFAEIPSATIDAAIATEKPARVRKNGSVIEANPVLMPYGSKRKKNVRGLVVDPGFGTVVMQSLRLAA